jgi:hypothetical protein
MAMQSDSESTARWYDRMIVRWALVACVLAAAVVIAAVMIARAIPDKAEAQVEIAGWRVPVGVVVDTGGAPAAPGLLLGSLLGGDPIIRIDAGGVLSAANDRIEIRSYAGDRRATYRLDEHTRLVDARRPLSTAALPSPDEAAAVITRPNSDTAIAVVTGVTRR